MSHQADHGQRPGRQRDIEDEAGDDQQERQIQRLDPRRSRVRKSNRCAPDFALQLDADTRCVLGPARRAGVLVLRGGRRRTGDGPEASRPVVRVPRRLQGKAGEWLDGGLSYRLRVPSNPPVKLFWSVTVYDIDTRALIFNDQKIADRSSRIDLRKNDDGSVDIYCGPKAPAGFEKNWTRRSPAGTDSRISGSTSRPRPTSIGLATAGPRATLGRAGGSSRTLSPVCQTPHRGRSAC